MYSLQELQWLLFIQMLIVAKTSEAKRDWSTELLEQTSRLRCYPQELKTNTTFLHGTKSGNFTKLGKVKDIDVCAMLCCELQTCDAAFMARNNCFAVNCYNRNLCVTAPARRNKWKPMVVFVKRAENQSQQEDKSSALDHKESAVGIKTFQAVEATSTRPKPHATFVATTHQPVSPTPVPREDGNTQVNNELKNPPITNSREFSDNLQKTNKEDFIIKAEPRKQTADFEEIHKLSQIRPKAKHQTEGFRDSRYSLISAAVTTCLMAFVLSGFAVIAAKMKKNSDEQEDDHLEAGTYQRVSTDAN